MMEESGRLSRGIVKKMEDLKVDRYDFLVVPGGSGVAKNFNNFLLKGANSTVDPEIERIVKEFHSKNKPMGFCCIAPTIAARVFGTKFGGPGADITMGKVGSSEWPFAAVVGIFI